MFREEKGQETTSGPVADLQPAAQLTRYPVKKETATQLPRLNGIDAGILQGIPAILQRVCWVFAVPADPTASQPHLPRCDNQLYTVSPSHSACCQRNNVMISIQQLLFEYPASSFRLQIPSLQIRSGEHTAVAGPSGSGKTTLLNLLAGILVPCSGSVSVASTTVSALNPSHRRLFRLQQIGQVFQDFQLLDYLSVVDNVLLPCRIHPSVRLTSSLRSRALELLEQVGLATAADRSITRLSQGERQRVALCRALLLSPQLILADEPTGNLDSANAQRMIQLLISETNRSGATLIMVTHDSSLLPQFERVIPFESFLRPEAVT